MTKASTLLLYWCTLVALFLSLSGFLTVKNTEGIVFQLLFLPITLYFLFSVFRNLKSRTLDVNLSGRTTSIVVFVIIFAILLGLAIRNILAQPRLKSEQVKSSQEVEESVKSEKDTPLIFKREENK